LENNLPAKVKTESEHDTDENLTAYTTLAPIVSSKRQGQQHHDQYRNWDRLIYSTWRFRSVRFSDDFHLSVLCIDKDPMTTSSLAATATRSKYSG
jgi:hypothetical protein